MIAIAAGKLPSGLDTQMHTIMNETVRKRGNERTLQPEEDHELRPDNGLFCSHCVNGSSVIFG
jgi:hypothetical protein